ncbi:MAG TPA: MFS transporter [Nocardioidaceae bacterium]|nr:MFS transporter [Nocardioidaceae bacterium]
MSLASGRTTAQTTSRSPLRQAKFARYLVGVAVDLVGDQAWTLVLAWAVARATDAGTAGFIIAAGTVPRLVLLLPAGTWVDRLGPLWSAQVAQAARVLIMVGATIVAVAGPRNVPLLVTLAVAFGIADSLRMPAVSALLPSLLPNEGIAAGQGLVGTVTRLSSIVAGPVAGIALAHGGFAGATTVNGVLFSVSLIAFISLGKTGSRTSQVLDEIGGSSTFDGLRYLARHRGTIAVLVVVATMNMFLAGPFELGIVLRVREEDWGSEALGVLVGAFGAAAAAGAMSLSVIRPKRRPLLIGFLWVWLAAAAVVTLGYAPSLPSAVGASAVIGLAIGPAGALLIGNLQATTDRAFLGRVMSVVSFSAFGVTPVGIALFGYLAGRLGVSDAFAVSGSVVLVLASVASIAAAAKAESE